MKFERGKMKGKKKGVLGILGWEWKDGLIMCLDSVDLVYKNDENRHVLFIDLKKSSKVCFKSHIGLNHKIGEKDETGNLKKEFKTQKFSDLIADDNAELKGSSPVAAFNTDYVSKKGSPMDINVVTGYNYSGSRKWSSLAISKNNELSIVNEYNNNLYNVSGGGPRLYDNKVFNDPCQNIGWISCNLKRARTFVGITENNQLIVVVTDNLATSKIDDVLNLYAEELNTNIVDGLMFDGGGSPSMMHIKCKNSICREGHNKLIAALLIFTGEVCIQ